MGGIRREILPTRNLHNVLCALHPSFNFAEAVHGATEPGAEPRPPAGPSGPGAGVSAPPGETGGRDWAPLTSVILENFSWPAG